jgi:hypothetical protein
MTLGAHTISSQGRTVLQALAATHDGRLATADVRRCLQRPGTASSVTRASLSRTLRRLWHAGLVELEDDRRRTLTTEADRLRHLAEVVCANPDSAYQTYANRMRQQRLHDHYGSAGRYAAAYGHGARAAFARAAGAIDGLRTRGG